MQKSIGLSHLQSPEEVTRYRASLSSWTRALVLTVMGMSQTSFSLLSNAAMYHHDLAQRGFVMRSFGSYRLYHHPAHPISEEWIVTLRHTLSHYPAHLLDEHLRSIAIVPSLRDEDGQSIDGRAFGGIRAMELRSELPSPRLRENVIHHEIAHLLIHEQDPIRQGFDHLYGRSHSKNDFWPTRITLAGDLYARSSTSEDIAVTAEALFFDGGYHWKTRSPLAHKKYYLLKSYYEGLGIKMRVGEYTHPSE